MRGYAMIPWKMVAVLAVVAALALALATTCSNDRGESTALSTDTPDQSVSASIQPPKETPEDIQSLPRDVSGFGLLSEPGGAASDGDYKSPSVEDVLEAGLYAAGASPTHVAFRGTTNTDSVRCDWRGSARTLEQREEEIRFWLGLDDDTPLPSVSDVEARFTFYIDGMSPSHQDYIKARLFPIAQGGLSEEYLFLTCFADFTASEYLLGAGPTTLTVAYDRLGEMSSHDLYLRQHEDGTFGNYHVQSREEYEASLQQFVSDAEQLLAEAIGGRASVVFLAPMGAHYTIAVEAWQAVAQWDLQTDDQGVMHAVRYGTLEGDPEHKQTLTNLKSRITAATTPTPGEGASGSSGDSTPAPTPTRVANVSGLAQYYRDMGAYGDITPDDGSTTTFTPAQPPPTHAAKPTGFTASPSGEDTANLSWSAVSGASGYQVQHRISSNNNEDVESWTTASSSVTGTSHTVTGLWCGKTHEFRVGAFGNGTTHSDTVGLWSDVATTTMGACTAQKPRFEASSYTFKVPTTAAVNDVVGTVSAYDVNGDTVTYSISAGNTANKLSINTSTGEIKVAAALSSPTTFTLTVGADDGVSGTTSVTITVSVLAPTCSLGAAIPDPRADYWLARDCEALLAMKDGLRGTGTLNWSAATAIASWDGVTIGGTPRRVTGLNLSSRSLTGSIPADMPLPSKLVTLDLSANQLTGTIPSGLGDLESLTRLNLSSNQLSGAIPVELGLLFKLTHLNLSSNSLTGDLPRNLGGLSNLTEIKLSGNTLTGCIPLSLRSVATNDLSSLNLPYCQPPAPGAPTAGTASENSIPLSWTAVSNTSKYRVEYREGTVGSWTVDNESITGTTHTVDELRCETEYQFRLSAYGSGTTYAAAWSDPSQALTKSTGMCVSPVFDEESYAFKVSEAASVGDAVGVVSATDPNDDTLTYSVTAGNEGGQFAIDSGTGAITLAGALDFDIKSTYTLTVGASDGANDASVSVEITEGNLPPVFPTGGFSFSVNESVGAYGAVGYAVATDLEGDAVLYSITGGNPNRQFSIDGHRGLIVVFLPLSFNARSSYTLTVRATDAQGNASSTTVAISVVQTAEDPPPAPMGLTASLEDVGNLIITWNDVANASTYRLRYRTDSNGEWTTSAAATGTSQTLSSVTCGATYEVQVQAQGDGVSYTAAWSDPSESVSKAVPLCPAPAFGETSYDLTVAEDASVGTTVGTVAATHPDQTKLTYSITAGNDDGKFSIGAGGVITVADALDHETTSDYSLTVVATEPRGKSDTATVAITVTDVNEAPSFDATSYIFTTAEDAAVEASLGSVSATDPDEDTLTFSITAGDDDGNFSIDSDGAISLAKTLDYETTSSYTLTVEAADSGGLSDTATVAITVTNVNEVPSFDATSYTFTVPENSAVTASLGSVSVTDPDEDTLTYSITAGDDDGNFSIDSSGAISLAKTLDYETTSSYTLTVEAADPGGLSDTATVAITVTNVNEAPSFDATSYIFTTAEDAAVEASLGSVSATDPDEDTLTFSITAGDDDGNFSIDSDGAISLAKTLDYETTSSYTLTVEAADSGGLSDTATVAITVTNVNEVPSFDATSYTFTVPENSAVTASLGSVSVTDPDEDTLTYSITAGDDDGNFSIDSSGAISLAKTLDYETTSSYTLTVEAADPGGLSDTATVAITVTNVNEAPSFDEEDYTFTTAEDAVVAASLGSVSATDPDEDTLTFTITAGNDDGNLSIDSSGAISLAKTLDHETTSSYTLTVQAADPGGLSDTATVTITVTNVNEAPAFDSTSYTFTTAEDVGVAASLGSVSATDPDEDTLTYSITAGDDDGNFSIDSSGAISLAKTLDYETTSSYTLTVEAADPGSLSDTATVAITVTNVNEVPSFEAAQYTFTISENAAVNTSLGSVSATDPDEDTLTLSITAGDDDDRFSIDSSGAISLAKALDYETTSSYTLTVEAADPGGLSDTASVAITVTNVNEAPAFDDAQYTFTVPEGSAIGHSVGTSAATDQDNGDTLTYSISGEAFEIDANGAITVAAALDHETTESYSLTVTVEDGSGLSDTATVAITVTNVNEVPSFDSTSYIFTVAENAILGELLGNVSATDPDEHDTLTYSIDGDKFTISAGGAVTVAQLLDYETAGSYSLTATVEDQKGLSGTATVSITVTDVDETPAFDSEKYSFTVSEDAAVGAIVGTLTASDANVRQGQTLTYSVHGDAAFTIDATTGQLKVASALDYETYLSHELTATVTDETGLADAAVVNITVRNVAEVAPPVPGGLEADFTRSGFELSWNSVDGADQYRIQYRSYSPRGKWINVEATTSTSQTFNPEGGTICRTTYQFRVQAYGDGETHPARWGSRSSAVATSSLACIKPAAPTGLTATVENGSVVLSWTAPAGSDVTAYQILRRRAGIELQLLVLVENTGGTGTTYTDSTVEAGVHYIYRVKAINNTISGPNSKRVEVRIPRWGH